MKNRKFNIDPKTLNYTVIAPQHQVKGHPKIKLSTRAVIGVFPPTNGKTDKDEYIVFSKAVPFSFSIGTDKGKKQPENLLQTISGLYKDARVVSIDKVNKGAQIALTTGKKHEEDLEQFKPIYSWEKNGWTVQMYRVFLYRYDQLKNDHFVEVVISKEKDHSAESIKTIHLFIPTKSRNISVKDGETPYEDFLFNWLQTMAKENIHKTGDLRDYLYREMFGGRKEEDFPDKKTQKYEDFNKLRLTMTRAEARLGNNPVSVWCAFVYFFWNTQGKEKLENDMLGYFGKKFYTLYNGFMEIAGIDTGKTLSYDFPGD